MYILGKTSEFFLRRSIETNSIIKSKKVNQLHKGKVMLTYLWLRLKQLLLVKILKLNLTKEKMLGYEVSFPNYNNFVYLFKEIFVTQQYYFDTKLERPLILDCGSNIGMALLFFKKLYPEARVMCFEPDGEIFKKLQQNVQTNGLRNVEVHNKAVFNREGTVNLFFDPSHQGSLVMTTKKERALPASSEVGCVLLSNYIKERVDFVKMDIEGAENVVLEELSSRGSLSFVKEMVIEYHHHIEPDENKMSEVLKTLEENNLGYEISSCLENSFSKGEFQDILIYAYQKSESVQDLI